MFFKSSFCLVGQHGRMAPAVKPHGIWELSENIKQNLRNKLLPQTVVLCSSLIMFPKRSKDPKLRHFSPTMWQDRNQNNDPNTVPDLVETPLQLFREFPVTVGDSRPDLPDHRAQALPVLGQLTVTVTLWHADPHRVDLDSKRMN